MHAQTGKLHPTYASTLFLPGGFHRVLDLENVIARHALGLHTHFQCPSVPDDVPFPVGSVLGFLVMGEHLDTDLPRVPTSKLKEITLESARFR